MAAMLVISKVLKLPSNNFERIQASVDALQQCRRNGGYVEIAYVLRFDVKV